MQALITAAGIVFLAGFTHTLSGFGFGLIATPLLIFVVDPKLAVPANLILANLNTIMILVRFRKYIQIRRVGLLLTGGIVGIPVGVYLLSSLNSLVLKLIIGSLIIPFSALLLFDYKLHFKRYKTGHITVGFMHGSVMSTAAIGGPPVVLYLLSQGLATEWFIGTISAYFWLTQLMTIVAYLFKGLITLEVLKIVAISLPALGIGFYIGNRARRRIDSVLFKRIAASVIFVAAVIIIVTSVSKLV